MIQLKCWPEKIIYVNLNFNHIMVKCFFCNEAEAEEDTAYEVNMYKVQSTKYGFIENKLTKSLSIPRCSRCLSVHKMRGRVASIIS